ncbi:MAG: fumarylacetoacetase [Actinomycetota bacterium]|nr:fumarylacetoacetase [Actinomycetota bacterium]
MTVHGATWVQGAAGSQFPITNLPYGAFTVTSDERPRLGVAIGDHVLDLAAVLPDVAALAEPSLNAFMAMGRSAWAEVRARIIDLLCDTSEQATVEPHLVPIRSVQMHLPLEVADYVDFYSSEHHARNLGRILRPGQPELADNWKHLPIGYHGRAGTARVSGTPVVRPRGQRLSPSTSQPEHGPTRRLDIEAEVGWVVGVPSELGRPVPLHAFRDHVFGACLVNDWSARDLQSWEYVPLGPFLGKSFLTSVSPWIVPLAALDDAWLPPVERDTPLLAYLDDTGRRDGIDLTLEVRLNGTVVSRPPFAGMYWTAAQQLAHLTTNGASVRTGDLYASGTVSGPEPNQRGSLIELSWNGTAPIRLDDGSTRTFLEDGDEVIISATAPGPQGTTIGFGSVRGRVVAE